MSTSSLFPVPSMRESAHLLGAALLARGRCGFMDPAGVGAVPAAGVAVAVSSIACSSVRAPQAHGGEAPGRMPHSRRSVLDTNHNTSQHPPPHTTTHQELAVLWTGGAAYTAPHEDKKAWRVSALVVW